MKEFPFPDRMNAKDELVRDVLYGKISQQDRERICDNAWNVGVVTARRLLAEYPGCSICEIAEKTGLKIVRIETDKVSAGMRFFSEYYPKKNDIYVYLLSIRLFAKENRLTDEEAEELVLAHEYFHFLEEKRIGAVSTHYTIPRLSVGLFQFGKTGVAALSEIGAHGFARTYWDVRYGGQSAIYGKL